MPLRMLPAPVATGRPGWLTAGTARLIVLCAFIVAIGMVRSRLSPHSAGIVLAVGGGLVAFGAAALFVTTRRIAASVPLLDRSQRVAHAIFLQIRRTGLPILGLAFFLFWTFVYLGLWWYRPEGAFRGLSPNPRFADFFYYAVSTAFVSPPGDILAVSRGARTATMIELMTAFALLTAYLSSLVDWRPPPGPDAEQRARSPVDVEREP